MSTNEKNAIIEQNLAKVMSGWLLSHCNTKEINGESFEVRFSLLRLKNRNCFRVIHEEYFLKFQDAADLYDVDKKFDVNNVQEAIAYLREHGISIDDMR